MRGPVLAPPCMRQRPFAMAGARRRVLSRVQAPQRGAWKDRRLAPRSSGGLAALHGVLSSWPFVLPPAEGVDRAHERVRKRGGTPEQARGERRRLTGTAEGASTA